MLVEEIKESLKKAEAGIVELMTIYRKSLLDDIFIGKIELKRMRKNKTYFGDCLALKGELGISRIEFYKQVDSSLFGTGHASKTDDIKWIDDIREQVKRDFVSDFLSILKNLETETGHYIDAFDLNNARRGENMITLALIERQEI